MILCREIKHFLLRIMSRQAQILLHKGTENSQLLRTCHISRLGPMSAWLSSLSQDKTVFSFFNNSISCFNNPISINKFVLLPKLIIFNKFSFSCCNCVKRWTSCGSTLRRHSFRYLQLTLPRVVGWFPVTPLTFPAMFSANPGIVGSGFRCRKRW